MATRVGDTGKFRVTAAASSTGTFGVAPEEGDLVVVRFWGTEAHNALAPHWRPQDCSDDQGNHYALAFSSVGRSGSFQSAVWWTIAGPVSGAFNVTINPTRVGSFYGAGVATAHRGAGWRLGKRSYAVGTSTTPNSGTTATLSAGDHVVFGTLWVGSTVASIVVDAVSPVFDEDAEELDGSTYVSGESNSRIVSGTAAQSCGWTLASSLSWGASTVVFDEVTADNGATTVAASQATGKFRVAGAGTISGTFGSPPQEGDLIVARFWGYPNPLWAPDHCTDDQGHAYSLAQTTVDTGPAGGVNLSVWFTVCGPTGPTSITIATGLVGGMSYGAGCANSYVGSDVWRFDQRAQAVGSSSAPATGATAALKGTTSVVIATLGASSTNQASIAVETLAPPWVQDAEEQSWSSYIPGETDSRVVTTTTAVSCSWTLASSAPWVCGIVSFSLVIVAVDPPDPPDPPGGGGGGTTRALAIIDMCFGYAPSGKPGYRNWIKEHPDAVAHWYLSDIGIAGTYGAEDEVAGNDAGIYIGNPGKGRGLLPEYGLSAYFDGVNDSVEVDYDFSGLGSDAPFTFTALCSPIAITSAANRCIHQSGTTGGYLAIDTTGHFMFGRNGGTVVTLAETVEIEGEYLVIGRFDGTNMRLNAWSLHLARATDPRKLGAPLGSAGPTAVSIGPHGGSSAFIGKRASEEFSGRIQGVACIGASLTDDQCDDLLECCSWTDVTGDARADVPIDVAFGLFDDSPSARVAPVGSASFGLNNAEDNEGETLGWYSRGHADCRDGFQLGIPVRVSLGNDTASSFRFLGRLTDAVPKSGRHDDRLTHCTALDWMEEAARFNLQGIETHENITADEALSLIIGRMENKPHELVLDVGSDVYPIALDNTNDESAYAQSEFEKIIMSEMGLLYVDGAGRLVFENRLHRSTLGSVALTFDNAMWSVDAAAASADIINHVRATVHPRRVDAAATTVLFETSNRVAIDGGHTETSFQFKDPDQKATRFGGLDVVVPIANTHYTLNTAADGSGSNVSTDPSIEVLFEISGSGITATIENGYGARVYLALEVLGRGVYDYEPVTVTEKNDDSIKAIGRNGVVLDMPYQTLAPIGQGAAQQVLSVYNDETPRARSIELPAHKSPEYLAAAIQMAIADRVSVSEFMTAVSGEFFVNGLKLSWQRDKVISVLVFLTRADMSEYWLLDISELDVSTRLGFA